MIAPFYVRWLLALTLVLVVLPASARECPVRWWGSTANGGMVVSDNSLASLSNVCGAYGAGCNLAAGPPTYVAGAVGASSRCGWWDGGVFKTVKNGQTCPVVNAAKQWLSPTEGWTNAYTDSCPDDCPAMGTMASSGYYDYGTNPGSGVAVLACSGSCEVVFDGVAPSGWGLVSGEKHFYAQGSYSYTGNACQSGTAPQMPSGTAEKPEDTCPPGQVYGTVNDKPVCVASDGTTTEHPEVDERTDETTTTTTNPDGSTTTTTTSTTTDSSGNTQTTTTTRTCTSAGNCTSTTETTGDELDDEKEKEDPCEDAPDRLACMEAGDAPASSEPGGVTTPVAITPTDGWQSDMTCPADEVVQTTVAGPITISWSLLCTAADYARPLVIGVAWVVAIFGFMGLAKRD